MVIVYVQYVQNIKRRDYYCCGNFDHRFGLPSVNRAKQQKHLHIYK